VELAAGKTSSEFLVCGPAPFMTLVIQGLADAGVDRNRIHVEKFQSLKGDPFVAAPSRESATAEQAEVTVTLYGETHQLSWDGDQSLLVALETAGLAPPFSCREGRCSSCTCRLIEGEVQMVANNVLEAEDLAEHLILACQSIPVSTAITIEFE
jgi:3-ketosteroid 9alpha-monooxygenase subunit B